MSGCYECYCKLFWAPTLRGRLVLHKSHYYDYLEESWTEDGLIGLVFLGVCQETAADGVLREDDGGSHK